jgi:hypothetical protein
MFKSFDEDRALLPESDTLGRGQASGKTEMVSSRKIYLPRGSAQTKCGPQPYFYFASESGAVPSWMIDEITRRDIRNTRTG